MWWTKRERKCKSNKRTVRKRDQTDGERDIDERKDVGKQNVNGDQLEKK